MSRSSYRKLSFAALLGALLMGGRGQAGVPGVGIVIDCISDEFESPWTYNFQTNTSSNGLWTTEFRGAPETLQLIAPPGGAVTDTTMALRLRSVDNGDDASLGMEDLVSVFYSHTLLGRAVTFAETPSFVTWAYFPSVSTWPQTTDGSNCFGFRLGARDASLISADNSTGEYYPSLWAYRGSDGKGYLVARVGDGFVEDVPISALPSTAGWYTLGMSWDAQGHSQYYAAAGRVPLQAGHLLYTDTVSGRTMDTVQYHFYSLRFPATGATSADFLADRCRVSTRSLPRIPTLTGLTFNRTTKAFGMSIKLATAGFTYRLERRSSLTAGAWTEVKRFVSDGQPHAFSEVPGGSQNFYHVARGPETPPPAGTSLTNASRSSVPAISPLRRAAKTAPTWR